MTWSIGRLADLGPLVVHGLLKLRAEVFVVEQNCPYQDPDDKDLHSYHIFAHQGNDVCACARLVDPGISYKTPAIGRVVVSKSYRGTGLGKDLMKRTLDYAELVFPGQDITISAQCYLEKFYTELGFGVISEPYPEDDIPHVKMILKRKPQ
jgi:ElaA protein